MQILLNTNNKFYQAVNKSFKIKLLDFWELLDICSIIDDDHWNN